MNISKEEFLEKYGDVLVQFNNYYKYSFSYRGVAKDGTVVVVKSGGNANDIYRECVTTDIISVGEVDPFEGIASKDGETVAEFYDY